MGRGSTQILIRKILECLAKGTRSIAEIAEATGFDRAAISRYTNILAESGLLLEAQEGASKKFTLVPAYRTDTYFGLPLEQSAEKQISSVYHLIRKRWNEISSKKLLSTHAQKIAYKVISSCDELKIPAGWYIYGGISVATYDDAREYAYYGVPKKAESCVKEATEEYAKNDYAWQSKKLQYKDAPELYTIKEGILALLYGPAFRADPKRSLHAMIKKVRKLISLAPKNERKEYIGLLDAYQDLLLDIINKLDDAAVKEHTREIIVLFESVWRYIALFNFKHALLGFYPENILEAHFILDIKQQEDEITGLGTQLQALMPEDEITDPMAKKLREALRQIRARTPEERAKVEKEMKEYEEKYGLAALNEKIRDDFGF